ncbi:hypothetical protein RDWZM_003613 [Blomia tropicalis]|uniref:Uncharacterized protein n=1 Tax=Blomia tropicalis TaxID=40697 RepID=A0A9Q0RR17_BLOTA|nr:hypothetical protein RDWZM_003613 [Blomia tropicalis]
MENKSQQSSDNLHKTAVPIAATETETINNVLPCVRRFGSIIDTNSPRSFEPLVTSISGLKLNFSGAAFANSSFSNSLPNMHKADGDCSSSKIANSLPDCSQVVASVKDTTNLKRKFTDENCDSSTTSFSNQTNNRKLIAKKKKFTSPIKCESNNLSTKKPFTESQTLSSTSRNISLQSNSIPLERQLKWITEKDGHKDPAYFGILINQRFEALKETWVENEQLQNDIQELNQENELLEPIFNKIVEIKEMLLDNNDEL